MANIQKQIDTDKKAMAIPPPPPVVDTKPANKIEEPQKEHSKSGHTALPWVVAGIGGAAIITGVVVYATKPKMPANCSGGSGTCQQGKDQSDADFKADKDQAGKSRSQNTIGLIVGGAGIAVLAGGLIWHFLEHTNGSSSSPNASNGASAEKPTVTPAVGPGFAGLSFGGSF
jgi:hypothetical protein